MQNYWVLMVRVSASTPAGRRDMNLTAPTSVPESEAKPRAAASALNAAKEHVAALLGVDASDVVVDWYDFVVGDEPLGSPARRPAPTPVTQPPPELDLPCVMQRRFGGVDFEIEMAATGNKNFVDLAAIRVLGSSRAHFLTGYISHDGFAEFEVWRGGGALVLSSPEEAEAHVAVVRLVADELIPACRRWFARHAPGQRGVNTSAEPAP